MKVSELSGGELDRFVFKARGMGNHYQIDFNGKLQIWNGVWQENYKNGVWVDYCPSSNWAQGGKLVDEYDIWFSSDEDHDGQKVHIASLPPHIASTPSYAYQEGKTKLEAACRAIIASKYGEEVEE